MEHIRQKYNYYSDEIYSAEDFIRLSASQSTMFNNPYYIKCEGQKKVKSAKWLHEALDKYRKK
ncbi:MAG: hypothetical protein GQ531_10340 [Sulfurovum sp.]|nr:hypothetical protein [Sulfurovum sp.]